MNQFLNYTFLHFSSYSIKVSGVLMVLSLVASVFVFLQLLKKSIYSISRIDIVKRYTVYRLTKYLVFVISTVVAFQLLGFSFSVLIAGSAALLVGIGLVLQNLFSDYVSGLTLLLTSSVKVKDVIELKGVVCRVEEINLRTTLVCTREDKYIIVPNTELTRSQLINWTHSGVSSRFQVSIRVAYDSDVPLVMKLLKQAADEQKEILANRPPYVRLEDYEESGLCFLVLFWSEEVFRIENIKSKIRIRVFELFKENKIKIPFPQRVLHIKGNVEEDK